MSEIEKLIQFEPKKKAIATEVNSNFETLRLSNNEHSKSISILGQKISDLKSNPIVEITCNTEILELSEQTNNFKVKGTTPIKGISGILNGFVFIEFLETRLIVSSSTLRLQNNVDRICKNGDIGIYLFENGSVKEVNYFTAKEVHTNSFKAQTILNAPKDSSGRSDFIKNITLTPDIMPIMTDYENEFCKISASSIYDTTNYIPWKAFRHHTNDIYGWLSANGVNTGWVKVDFKDNSPKIMAFAINARNTTDANTHSPCDFIIEGSNDDTNWTLLGDYTNNLNWLQNEKRYFALSFFNNFRYYKITITKNSGGGAYSGFGALEFFEAKNEYLPRTAKIDLSMESPLLINNGIGMSTSGKLNRLAILTESLELGNLLDNATSFIAVQKNSEEKFVPYSTTAQPVYSSKLQKHSNKKSVPTMISYTTSREFDYGYTASASSFLTITGASFPAWLAFNGNLANKWAASVVGNNQWLQIDFPNYRKAARFSITASADVPTGCIKKGYIKGFNGEEWIILKEVETQTGWLANQERFFDVDVIASCSKFKLEILEIENPAVQAQLAEFQVYELACCFVIPENKFYSYNAETKAYEEKEMNFIGRITTRNGIILDSRSYSIENKYESEEIPLAINTNYSFSHNIGADYSDLKISGWIKDKVNGFIMPWCVDSNIDYSCDVNNYGFYFDDCNFMVRIPTKIMQYRDYYNINRAITSNCTMILNFERSF